MSVALVYNPIAADCMGSRMLQNVLHMICSCRTLGSRLGRGGQSLASPVGLSIVVLAVDSEPYVLNLL